MKTILVTTDFSEESKKAFPIAKELASLYNSKILLLSVMENPALATMAYAIDVPILPDPNIQKELESKLKLKLEEVKNTFFANCDCESKLIETNHTIDHEILSFAKNISADLIVVATHGRTGLARLLIGSIAEKIVRGAHCPVLSVPSNS